MVCYRGHHAGQSFSLDSFIRIFASVAAEFDLLHKSAGVDRVSADPQAGGEDPKGGNDAAAEGPGRLRGVQDQEAGVHGPALPLLQGPPQGGLPGHSGRRAVRALPTGIQGAAPASCSTAPTCRLPRETAASASWTLAGGSPVSRGCLATPP